MAGDPQNDDPQHQAETGRAEPAETGTPESETESADRTPRGDAQELSGATRSNGLRPADAAITHPDEAQPGTTATTADVAAAGTTRPVDDMGDAGASDGDGEVKTVEGTPARTVIREIVETLMLALLVFLAVRASFQNFKVDGESMMPTLHNGQFMIVNKIEFAQVDAGQLSRFIPFLDASPHEKRDVFHGPGRGDIVVLVNPREPDMDLVKRVIGLPGETLQIVDGHVYINDHLLIEPYIKQPWGGSTPKITIPAKEYFVMGDNRTNSLDSRSQQVGLIPRDLMIGKAMVTYWPLSRFGLAPNGSPTLSKTQTTPQVASAVGGFSAGS